MVLRRAGWLWCGTVRHHSLTLSYSLEPNRDVPGIVRAWWSHIQWSSYLVVTTRPFLRQRILSPFVLFSTSLLRLQVNHTACCRVCGWVWNWTSIFVSQPIVLVTLILQSLTQHSSNISISISPFFFWFCVFPSKQISGSTSIFPSCRSSLFNL